jgi:hypothetical protein
MLKEEPVSTNSFRAELLSVKKKETTRGWSAAFRRGCA